MAICPPPTIAWLVDAVGEHVALSFVESAGGRRLWVPRRWHGSRLEAVHGEAIAEALSERVGGEHFEVPVCREWRALILYSQGLSLNDIAARAGCSRSTIIRIIGGRTRGITATREQSQQDARQLALFG
nr:helix-turn-helix domain-containing protein [uncultured Neokomagataea sp.]